MKIVAVSRYYYGFQHIFNSRIVSRIKLTDLQTALKPGKFLEK
jgi:hypothetical protein